MRVGIYGGSFNPPHMGHVNALVTVAKKAGLDQIRVIPVATSPMKVPIEGPSPEQRLEMTRRAFESYGSQFVIDDREIRRGGISYTIDTVLDLRKTIKAEDLYLIIGADHLDSFHQWKDYKKILIEANLIVTTRPGFDIPTSESEFPGFLNELVAAHDFNFIELKTGRSIQFLRLQDVEVSSSEIRKKIRSSRPVEKVLPLAVESYIRENKLYSSIRERITDYQKFTEFCASVLFSKKAIGVKGFDLQKMAAPSEFTLVASGTSTRHAASLAENLVTAVKDEFHLHPQSVEGLDEGRWVVVDYGSLIVHIFYDFVRQEYNLEGLWKMAKDLGIKDPNLKA
ncbi:MAG: nicotinate (nicotinamide) nucleotide adenylyltransferase [Bdellovibrionales bacterium]|nr:nicotinate (nicotinamide) nucleotide adenylyltransferase [Bdellovibrionales bacterium]